VRDRVHRRLPHIWSWVPESEREVGEHEAPPASIDVEHHAMSTRWRWQIQLDAVRQAGPVWALWIARPQLIDRDPIRFEDPAGRGCHLTRGRR
jgi:hypothetical protein